MGLMCLLAVHLLQCRSSLCLHPESGLSLSCFYIASLWLWQFLCVGHRQVIFAPSFLCMESKALAKSTTNIVACRFFAHTPSRIQRIVKICDIMDLFLWKPFWFFLNIFSVLGSMQLRSRALYILAAVDIRVTPW